ncbi:cytochrome P450 [Truncatella angustata]|uniref:Cytochrome P450 n=1 Tax=Truncatella angustata TaxID=152316 RepID=A0A9P8UXS2_9PEZI|nr:cytochrome P450 [Truncatella angustata]KAH6659961.1 cytochrome P450 [Truncatella angustata]
MSSFSEALFRPEAWPTLIAILIGFIIPTLLLRRYSKLSDIPGPFFASITRLWHVRHIIIGDQNVKLVELHKEHGHFVRVSHDEVSVSHPDAMKKILLAPLRKFPDWRWENPFAELDPKKKIERSRNFAPAYALSSILKSEAAIDDVIAKLCDWMNEYADEKKPMDLDWFFTYASFDIIGEVIFSKQFGFIETGTDVKNAIHNVANLNAYGAIAGFYHWFHYLVCNPLVTWTQLMPYGHMYDVTFTAIDQRRKNPDARYDLIAHWLKQHEEHPERLSMRNIEAHSFQAVGAGSDTVSSGLQSFVYHIIRNPEGRHWQKCRDEIRDAQSQGMCNERVVSFADAQKLPYLQACIKEGLRVFSPTPMGLPREVPTGGLTIGDKTFAAGTILSVNSWVMHYSTEIWGPDAAEFRPERWLGEDADALDKYFMVWGQGYAACPGQKIARLEMSKITATIVRDYDIRQVDPQQQWVWKARFAMLPHEWPVYVTKANSWDNYVRQPV